MVSADFTIADVLEFARARPADERYNYGDSWGGCALCQFFDYSDIAYRYVGGTKWCAAGGIIHQLDQRLADTLSGEGDWTFGGLVGRLEALVHETPVAPSVWTRLDAYLTDIELASA